MVFTLLVLSLKIAKVTKHGTYLLYPTTLNTQNDGQIQMYPTLRDAANLLARIRRSHPHPCAGFAEKPLSQSQDYWMEHGCHLLCCHLPIQRFQHQSLVHGQRALGDETNRLASHG